MGGLKNTTGTAKKNRGQLTQLYDMVGRAGGGGGSPTGPSVLLHLPSLLTALGCPNACGGTTFGEERRQLGNFSERGLCQSNGEMLK